MIKDQLARELSLQMADTRIERIEIPNGDKLAETMTKREAFAMAAMQGFASDPDSSHISASTQAADAIEWADALLVALEKRNG